jgi:hypothetical protein
MRQLFLSVFMLLAVASSYGQTTGTAGDLSWTFENGTLTINGTGEMPNYDSAGHNPPWYLFRKDITSVIIEQGVESIGDFAFCDSYLASITLPTGISYIGRQAFALCGFLESVTLPESVAFIGYYAFSYCSNLASINIPKNVNSIGIGAFAYCNSLTSINIPKDVNSIEDLAFAGCSSLTDVTVNWDITADPMAQFPSVSSTAFSGLTLSNITLHVPVGERSAYEREYPWKEFNIVEQSGGGGSCVGGAFGEGDALRWELCEGVLTVSGVGVMPDYAYDGSPWYSHREDIASVIVESGVTVIGNSAFQRCTNLVSVTIPTSVTAIGDFAFFICSNLMSITLPNSVHSIGLAAFSNCIGLTSIVLPESVTSIGDEAFFYCSNLASVTLPKSVNSIGSLAFGNCSSLTDITVNWTTTPPAINSDVFTGLTLSAIKLHVPAGTRAVYEVSEGWNEFIIVDPAGGGSVGGMFGKGGALRWELRGGTLTISGTGAMPDYNMWSDIYAPWYSEYRSWIQAVVVESGVEHIGAFAFYSCDQLKSVTLPESVTSIDEGAFSYCYSLTSINIPKSITAIRAHLFFECSSLVSVTIPEGVTSIGFQSFTNCYSLTSINLPASVSSIEMYAFADCYELAEITVNWTTTPPETNWKVFEGLTLSDIKLYVPAGTRAMYEAADGWKAFNIVEQSGGGGSCHSGTFGAGGALRWKLCDGTLTVSGVGVIPNYPSDNAPWSSYKDDIIFVIMESGIERIGSSAFSRCSSLASITLPTSITSIGEFVFFGCSSLESVVLPTSLNTIGYGAFNSCSSLKAITIPASVTSIENEAFGQCSSLVSVIISENVHSIGFGTFYECSSLESITIPESVASIGRWAFNGCRSLADVTVNWTTTPPSMTGEEFYTLNLSDIRLHVPAGTRAMYEVTDGWKAFNIVEQSGSSCHSGTFGAGGTLTWELCNGVLTVGGTGRMPNDGSDSQPWFPYHNEITSAVIESGVENVGVCAFVDFIHLKSAVIPASVTSIEDRAFAGCSGLIDVTVNWNVAADPMVQFPSVSSTAFSGLTLSNITLHIPAGERAAYESNDIWKEFNIVEQSGSSCHSGTFGAGGTLRWELCDGTLTISGVGAMPDYDYDGSPWYLYKEDITTLIIESGVVRIGAQAFYGCDHLASVMIPETVTAIGFGALAGCGMESIIISASVTSIEEAAFAYCQRLTGIAVASNNPSFSSEDGVLFDKNKATIIQYPAGKTNNSYTLPESVVFIGNYAFSDCDNLESVTVPASVTTIGRYAFISCSRLKSVSFSPSSLLSTIGMRAFVYCDNLKAITLPISVTSIESGAFSDCGSLTDVTVNWTATPLAIRSDLFGDLTLSNITLHVPAGTKAIYEAADVWREFNIVGGCDYGTFGTNDALTWEMCDGILTISGAGAIPDYDMLAVSGTGETPNNSGTSNRPPWYAYREEITSIIIESEITAIGARAFADCINLTDLTVNWTEAPPAINSNIFEGLTLPNITLHVPEGTESMYEDAEVWKEFNIEEQPPVRIKDTPQANSLKAYVKDGVLRVNGLAAGEALNVYGITGTRMYRGVSDGNEATVTLREHGVYIVVSGGRSIKVVY